MPRKKKLGSKLVSGVRQVQMQRSHAHATEPSPQVVGHPVDSTTTPVPSVPVAEQSAKFAPGKPVAGESTKLAPVVPSTPVEAVAPRATKSPEKRLNISHPRRVWPD